MSPFSQCREPAGRDVLQGSLHIDSLDYVSFFFFAAEYKTISLGNVVRQHTPRPPLPSLHPPPQHNSSSSSRLNVMPCCSKRKALVSPSLSSTLTISKSKMEVEHHIRITWSSLIDFRVRSSSGRGRLVSPIFLNFCGRHLTATITIKVVCLPRHKEPRKRTDKTRKDALPLFLHFTIQISSDQSINVRECDASGALRCATLANH